MREKTINALIELGMPADVKGFHYIIEAMNIFEEDASYIHSKITKLYTRIAENNNSTAAKVERAIRHAFSIVYKIEDNPAIDKYLTRHNITNGNLLGALYLRLSMGN